MLFANFLKKDYVYETAPIKRMVPVRHYNLQEHFGGNLYPYVAELKNGLLLLLDNKLKVMGVCADEDNLVGIQMDVLKEIAKANKIQFDWRKTTKEDLIRIIQEHIKGS